MLSVYCSSTYIVYLNLHLNRNMIINCIHLLWKESRWRARITLNLAKKNHSDSNKNWFYQDAWIHYWQHFCHVLRKWFSINNRQSHWNQLCSFYLWPIPLLLYNTNIAIISECTVFFYSYKADFIQELLRKDKKK